MTGTGCGRAWYGIVPGSNSILTGAVSKSPRVPSNNGFEYEELEQRVVSSTCPTWSMDVSHIFVTSSATLLANNDESNGFEYEVLE